MLFTLFGLQDLSLPGRSLIVTNTTLEISSCYSSRTNSGMSTHPLQCQYTLYYTACLLYAGAYASNLLCQEPMRPHITCGTL